MRIPSLTELRDAGATEHVADRILRAFRDLTGQAPDEAWRFVSKQLLHPDQPFSLHKLLAQCVHEEEFAAMDHNGHPPLWVPTPEGMQETNIARFMHQFEEQTWRSQQCGDPRKDFPRLQMLSFDEPEIFWPAALRALRIKFHNPPTRVVQVNHGDPDATRWLPGATLNIAESCVACRDPDSPAVVWAADGAPESIHYLSYGQLRHQIANVATSLHRLGFKPGESIAICMPMTAPTVALYLGIIWAGCVVVSIADSFSQDAVASRLKVSSATCMFTQDIIMRGGKTLPLYSKLASLSLKRGFVVLPADPSKGTQVECKPSDISWEQFLNADARAGMHCPDPYISDAYNVCNILFSSGTTGEPKAIPWTHVTPIRCGLDAWGHQDIRSGDVVVWPTNLGWMMGPWLIFAALLNGAAVALYEGSPLGRDFGTFVATARVTMLGLVPSIAKAWRSSNCMHGIDWGSIRCFSSSGEASNSDDYHWLMARAGGTEIGGGYFAGSMVLPSRPGSFSTPTLGCRIAILAVEDASQQIMHSLDVVPCSGEIAILPPMLGTSQWLLNRNHHEVYFEGMPQVTGGAGLLRRHGDSVKRLRSGVYCAQGRCDDTMNLGGIKVSSVEIENACMAAAISGVTEVAAVGVAPEGGGPEHLVVFFATASSWKGSAQEIAPLFSQALKERLNPLFKVSAAVKVDALPRTASNKVVRRVLRDSLTKRAPHAKL